MRIKALLVVVVVGVSALLVAGAALATTHHRSKASRSAAVVRVKTRSVKGLGQILVNSRGLTLYMFVPDKRKRVTCVKVCARVWPPVMVKSGAKLVGVGKVKQNLLGSDRDPAGGRVATYHGWPLYTYVGDRKPGDVTGQALNLNGGLWYVLSPSGALIKKKVGAGSGSSASKSKSSCSDHDFDGDASSGGPDDGDGCL